MPLCPFLRHDFPLNSAESSAIKSTGLKALQRTLIFLQYGMFQELSIVQRYIYIDS